MEAGTALIIVSTTVYQALHETAYTQQGRESTTRTAFSPSVGFLFTQNDKTSCEWANGHTLRLFSGVLMLVLSRAPGQSMLWQRLCFNGYIKDHAINGTAFCILQLVPSNTFLREC